LAAGSSSDERCHTKCHNAKADPDDDQEQDTPPLDARTRVGRLSLLAKADPDLAAPGLAACRAIDAAYIDDMPAVEAALADMAQALGVGR
jgi:hypothetical protein